MEKDIEELKELLKKEQINRGKKINIHKWSPTITSIITILICFFALFRKLEINYNVMIEKKVKKYTETDDFKKKTMSILLAIMESTSMNKDIDVLKKVWVKYLKKEIDKQLYKLNKDELDLKPDDLRFIVDVWKHVKDNDASYSIKVSKIKNHLLNN